MTDPNYPQRVSLNAPHGGGAHRSPGDVTPSEPAPAVDGIEPPVGGIDILYYEDDPSEAFLMLTLPSGETVQVPLSEMKLRRLSAGIDAQREAVAQFRWEMDGGDPADYIPDTERGVGQYRAAPGDDYDESPADEYVEDSDVDEESEESLGQKVLRKTDPLHMRDAADYLQTKSVKDVSVQTILLWTLGAVIVLSLLIAAISGFS